MSHNRKMVLLPGIKSTLDSQVIMRIDVNLWSWSWWWWWCWKWEVPFMKYFILRCLNWWWWSWCWWSWRWMITLLKMRGPFYDIFHPALLRSAGQQLQRLHNNLSPWLREWGGTRKTIIITIIITRPKPPYGRQGLARSWGKDTVGQVHFEVFSTSHFVPLALSSDWILLF